jgi:hypothetical protein
MQKSGMTHRRKAKLINVGTVVGLAILLVIGALAYASRTDHCVQRCGYDSNFSSAMSCLQKTRNVESYFPVERPLSHPGMVCQHAA